MFFIRNSEYEGMSPLASPIYYTETEAGIQNQDHFKEQFPYRQKILGDGACYLNACLVGILSKCVNKQEKWDQFKKNLKNWFPESAAVRKISPINTLTREKANELMQTTDDQNVLIQLIRDILLDSHGLFIKGREKLIEKLLEEINLHHVLASRRDQSERKEITDKISTLELLMEDLRNQISSIPKPGVNSLATAYDVEDLKRIIENLSENLGLKFESLSANSINSGKADKRNKNLDDENTIFLWNSNGLKHFDLLYSRGDAQLRRDVEAAVGETATIRESGKKSRRESNNSSRNSGWNFVKTETITPEKEPQTKITVISVEPVVSNRQSVWLQDDGRGNKFRVIDGVYENEDSEGNFPNTPRREIGQTFIGILQKIAKGEKGDKDLTTEQFLAIIDYAKKNGGVTNKYNASSQKYSDNEISELKGVDAQRAKRFSARFQEECRKCGIYTGREGANVKMVGLRLTFIPDDLVDNLKKYKFEDFSSKVEEIQGRVKKSQAAKSETKGK